MKQFKSKRNQVFLIELNKDEDFHQLAVKKVFSDRRDLDTEVMRYEYLKSADIRIPNIIDRNENILLLEYIEGKTTEELLTEQDIQSVFYQDVWDALIEWLVVFVKKTGFLMKDTNLRNFIYNPCTNEIYGIDFEGKIINNHFSGVSTMLAFVKLYEPENTPMKIKTYNYLKDRLCVRLSLDEKHLEIKIHEKMYEIQERRRKK